MTRSPLLITLAVFAAAFLPRLACADSTTIQAAVDGYVKDQNHDGTYDTVSAGDASFGAGSFQRGAAEFDASGVPQGATITGATLQLSIDITVGTTTNSVAFGTYAGNGSIDIADATASSSIVGTFTAPTTWSSLTVFNINLDPSAVQSSFNQSSYIGFNIWQTNGSGIGFTSLENVNPFPKPKLQLTYTIPAPAPEPSSLMLLAAAGPCLLRRRRCR